MDKSGSIKRIARFISNYTEDKVYQILILTFGLSPLVESVSGFGIAIIVIAPILTALGFNTMKSSLISLISLCIIPWGTLSLGTIIGSALGNVPLEKLGVGSALMCIPIYVYFAILVIYIGAGKEILKKRFLEAVTIGLLLGVSVWGANRFFSVELAGLTGSLIVISFLFFLIRLRSGKKLKKPTEFFQDIMPYFLLIILLFISRIIPPLKNILLALLTIKIEKYHYELPLLYSPGFFLIIVCLMTMFFYKLNMISIIDCTKSAINKCYPVIITTFLFLIVSEIMYQAEMIQILSMSASNMFGDLFIFISPLIGAMGGFLTGSNTASNTMFMRLQTETANHLGVSPIITSCAQNVSSSLMTMVNPSRAALSCTVTKNKTSENIIQKKIGFIGLGTILIILIELTIIYCLSYII